LGEESKLGELLDPIADKIIVATALILLVMDGTIRHYEVIAAIIILTREILISGLREFLAKGQIKLPVSNLRKIKNCFANGINCFFTFREIQEIRL
jgi:CDP-diacylglycerol--glycerol-3-phosphate 3-phosphatidyltransferase/cardiolipin synthase